jgi:hypothetical protein
MAASAVAATHTTWKRRTAVSPAPTRCETAACSVTRPAGSTSVTEYLTHSFLPPALLYRPGRKISQ